MIDFSRWQVVCFSTTNEVEAYVFDKQWSDAYFSEESDIARFKKYNLILYSLPKTLNFLTIERFVASSKIRDFPTLLVHENQLMALARFLENKYQQELAVAEDSQESRVSDWLDEIAEGAVEPPQGVSILQVYRLRRKAMKDERIIGVVGNLSIDIFVNLNQWPSQGEQVGAESIHQFSGGRGYAGALQVVRHEWYAMPIATLGDNSDAGEPDPFTAKIMHDLSLFGEERILLDGITFLPKTQADISLVLNLVNTQKTIPAGYVSNMRSDNRRIQHVVERCEQLFPRISAALISTDISVNVADSALNLAKKMGIVSVLQIVDSNIPEIETLRAADIVILSDKLAHLILSKRSEEKEADVVQEMAQTTKNMVLVTDCFSNCWVASQHPKLAYPAEHIQGYQPRKYHRLGVRSAFSASLAVLLAESRSIEYLDVDYTVRFALAAGSLKAEKTTLRTMPYRLDVEELLAFG